MPALVAWPAGIAAGKKSNHPAQFHDWMNTFAELAGLPQPERSDGVSIVPTLTGKSEQRAGVIYSEYSFPGKTPAFKDFDKSHREAVRRQMQMIYVNGYKAVRYNIEGDATPFRVYDTDKDPEESKNLAGKSGIPTQKEILAKMLQTRRAGGGVKRPYDNNAVPAVNPGRVVAGINFSAYAKQTPWVSNFENEAPNQTGTAPQLDLSALPANANAGAVFTGFLQIPADGVYEFFLETDTGAFVRLHDAQLIDADFGYTSGKEASSGKSIWRPVIIRFRFSTGTPRAPRRR